MISKSTYGSVCPSSVVLKTGILTESQLHPQAAQVYAFKAKFLKNRNQAVKTKQFSISKKMSTNNEKLLFKIMKALK